MRGLIVHRDEGGREIFDDGVGTVENNRDNIEEYLTVEEAAFPFGGEETPGGGDDVLAFSPIDIDFRRGKGGGCPGFDLHEMQTVGSAAYDVEFRPSTAPVARDNRMSKIFEITAGLIFTSSSRLLSAHFSVLNLINRIPLS